MRKILMGSIFATFDKIPRFHASISASRFDTPKVKVELFKKAGVLGRSRASADSNYSERDETNRRVGGSWIQITNVGSITSTAADQ
jgi:hypothetical protein